MTVHDLRNELGPLLTIDEDELVRPARRREDRDVLVLRIEIEAQRREVARLMALLRQQAPVEPPAQLDAAEVEANQEKWLLSPSDLHRLLGVSTVTLYRWRRSGRFPEPIRIGSMIRWKRDDIRAWIRARTEERSQQENTSPLPARSKKVRGGRSRWASTARTPVVIESAAPESRSTAAGRRSR